MEVGGVSRLAGWGPFLIWSPADIPIVYGFFHVPFPHATWALQGKVDLLQAKLNASLEENKALARGKVAHSHLS